MMDVDLLALKVRLAATGKAGFDAQKMEDMAREYFTGMAPLISPWQWQALMQNWDQDPTLQDRMLTGLLCIAHTPRPRGTFQQLDPALQHQMRNFVDNFENLDLDQKPHGSLSHQSFENLMYTIRSGKRNVGTFDGQGEDKRALVEKARLASEEGYEVVPYRSTAHWDSRCIPQPARTGYVVSIDANTARRAGSAMMLPWDNLGHTARALALEYPEQVVASQLVQGGLYTGQSPIEIQNDLRQHMGMELLQIDRPQVEKLGYEPTL